MCSVFNVHPEGRKDQTGEQLVKQIESSKPKDKMMMDQKYGQLLALNRRLKASKDEHVEFVEHRGGGRG